MRVAAVAFVLIVGAAVVLAFANTLNSWVLGGLLGGLAAILISVPISLALFTFLARRHEARQQSLEEVDAEELAFAAQAQMDYNDRMVYEAEGYTFSDEDDLVLEPSTHSVQPYPRPPVSGYLALPPAHEDAAFYEDEQEADLFELRNYPRQPRRQVNPQDQNYYAPGLPTGQPSTQETRFRRTHSTRSLSEHKSTALRMARQEAQQQQQVRGNSGSPSRRPQERRTTSPQRPRTSRHLRPTSPPPKAPGSSRPIDEQDLWSSRQAPNWYSLEDEDTLESEQLGTEHTQERYQQHYPRRPAYPRKPRASRYVEPLTGSLDEDEDEQEEVDVRGSRRDTGKQGRPMRNPVVRRAPYLYEDDPLREEFAQQLERDRPPMTRRSSRYEQYEEDDY